MQVRLSTLHTKQERRREPKITKKKRDKTFLFFSLALLFRSFFLFHYLSKNSESLRLKSMHLNFSVQRSLSSVNCRRTFTIQQQKTTQNFPSQKHCVERFFFNVKVDHVKCLTFFTDFSSPLSRSLNFASPTHFSLNPLYPVTELIFPFLASYTHLLFLLPSYFNKNLQIFFLFWKVVPFSFLHFFSEFITVP